jgi:hypothetical protein
LLDKAYAELDEARKLLDRVKDAFDAGSPCKLAATSDDIDAYLAAHPAKQQEQGKAVARICSICHAEYMTLDDDYHGVRMCRMCRAAKRVVVAAKDMSAAALEAGATAEAKQTQSNIDAQMRERGWEWQNKTTTYLAGWSKVVNAKKFKIWYDTGDNTWNAYMDELEWESFNHPTPTLAADACEEHAKQQEDKA